MTKNKSEESRVSALQIIEQWIKDEEERLKKDNGFKVTEHQNDD